MSALHAPAFEIWRESVGIPHIRAKSDAAAWEGLGCVHVRDRLIQMDLTGRRAYGRVAEWAGPEALPGDRFARRAGGEALARKNHAAHGDEARALLDAYARDANAEIKRLREAGQLPREYALLDQPEGPDPCQPRDSIAAMRQIGLATGSVRLKLFRAAALPSVGPEGISLLRHDDGGQDRFVLPPGTDGKRWVAPLADLAPSPIHQVQGFPGPACGQACRISN
ncbi:MAG: penicillin acylase family protein [Rhodobacteraceae bacterium]|uniref:penicillin acylase family protein n=1 Tax=Salipiger sp. HF18 TaxID=2721557 RepID=UPI00142DB85D|nr:penicillin acylase family protein [Salipiger sp. HF18]NIY95391.1 penicillin acylase family protein [Salipiger sp. HF18]NVK62388.1 penicillin acylase family protein [Paracoccaceae bacterium]